jgi:hypothetical protein
LLQSRQHGLGITGVHDQRAAAIVQHPNVIVGKSGEWY